MEYIASHLMNYLRKPKFTGQYTENFVLGHFVFISITICIKFPQITRDRGTEGIYIIFCTFISKRKIDVLKDKKD